MNSNMHNRFSKLIATDFAFDKGFTYTKNKYQKCNSE